MEVLDVRFGVERKQRRLDGRLPAELKSKNIARAAKESESERALSSDQSAAAQSINYIAVFVNAHAASRGYG